MSKRYINNMLPPKYGEFLGPRSKIPRLDITISNHNFPLSQIGTKQANSVNWADDDEDEMLLLASQACEQAYTSTSTPSCSFKRPISNAPTVSTIDLQNKCNRIASPLQLISSNVGPNSKGVYYTADLINDKIYKEQDTEDTCRQLLRVQEENAKLKSENGKLLEKCVTKEGEVSILRTQLKTCQVAVDNARLERVKAQEKVQMEFTEKLTAVRSEVHDLRTQLDFKNIEMISIKERYKRLESPNVKLTQVTLKGNEIISQRHNNTFISNQRVKKCTLVAACVQTEGTNHFIKLNKRYYTAKHKLKDILPVILKPTEHENSLLEYNERLQKVQDYSQTKCRILSTFHRIPSRPSPAPSKDQTKVKLSLHSFCEDISYIASVEGDIDKTVEKRYISVFLQLKNILLDVLLQLRRIHQRGTAAFYKEMDEKYVEATSTFLEIDAKFLPHGNVLYKDEQAILARRAVSVLSHMINCHKTAELWCLWELKHSAALDARDSTMELLCLICHYCDITSCAVLYSGFLMSLLNLLVKVWIYHNTQLLFNKMIVILKSVIAGRAMPVVICRVLDLLRTLSSHEPMLVHFCTKVTSGNMKIDCDQGVMLYKKETCPMQIILRQIEAALKLMEKQLLMDHIATTTQNLLGFYSNINTHSPNWVHDNQENKCNCGLTMMQVVVYSLHICATNLIKLPLTHTLRSDIEAICRCGLTVLYQWMLKDIEFSTQLGFNEGHYHIFIENCNHMKDSIVLDDVHGNMLVELMGTVQAIPEDAGHPSTNYCKVWIDSFDSFTISD